MEKFFHKKLVRDKLPEIIKATGEEGEVRVMGKREFEGELEKKLVEETKELLGVPRKDLPKEMADVLELLKSIAELHKIDFKSVEEKQIEKRKERGGFKKRLFLIWSSRKAGE